MKKFFGIIILIIFTIILYPIMVVVTVWNKLT